MGFRSGVPVVGLRVYFAFAISLGLFIGGIGLYGVLSKGPVDPGTASASTSPNLIVIGADSLRVNFDAEPLPHLAGLASRGLRATHAYGVLDFDRLSSTVQKLQGRGYTQQRFTPQSEAADLEQRLQALPAPFIAVIHCSTGLELDQKLERILAVLDRRGLTHRTAIFATAFGLHREQSPPARWHVPLVIWYPDVFPVPTTMDHFVWPTDVLITMEDLASATTTPASPLRPSSILSMRLSEIYHRVAFIEDQGAIFGGRGNHWGSLTGRSPRTAVTSVLATPVDPAVRDDLLAAFYEQSREQ